MLNHNVVDQVEIWSQMVVNQHSVHQHCLIRWVVMPWSDDTMIKLRDGFFLVFGILKAAKSSVVEQRLPNSLNQSHIIQYDSKTALVLHHRSKQEEYVKVAVHCWLVLMRLNPELTSKTFKKRINPKYRRYTSPTTHPTIASPLRNYAILLPKDCHLFIKSSKPLRSWHHTALSDDAAVIFQESKSCFIAEKRFQECW